MIQDLHKQPDIKAALLFGCHLHLSNGTKMYLVKLLCASEEIFYMEMFPLLLQCFQLPPAAIPFIHLLSQYYSSHISYQLGLSVHSPDPHYQLAQYLTCSHMSHITKLCLWLSLFSCSSAFFLWVFPCTSWLVVWLFGICFTEHFKTLSVLLKRLNWVIFLCSLDAASSILRDFTFKLDIKLCCCRSWDYSQYKQSQCTGGTAFGSYTHPLNLFSFHWLKGQRR